MSEYTLVIKGDCPAIGADTAVYLGVDRIQHFAGIVDSVLFEGNALSELENLKELLLRERKKKQQRRNKCCLCINNKQAVKRDNKV